MANHALPTTSSLYTDVLTNLKDRIDDSLKMLDSVNTSPTNVPTNAVRWNSTTKLWEKYNGSAWASLAASYAIQVLKSSNLVGGNSTTLLGSIPYQSNTDTTTLLAPNTTTTRKFLRQTGNGTNGSAPVWDTILASDVPTLNQSTTGNAATATKLATARTIGGVSFDGTADINLRGVNTTGNQNTTGNAATATKLTTSSSDWSASGVIENVVGMLAWKKYGNNHCIFDASASTAPNGAAVSNINSTVPWSPSFPTLMGWNGVNTHGVRVDSARVADSATTASSCTGNSATATLAADSNKLIGKTWNWNGQPGQPSWLWGGSDGTNMYVYDPASFVVYRANDLGNHQWASHGGNGYIRLSTGLIIQWGTYDRTTNGTTVTFNIAFPNACFMAVTSMFGSESSTAYADIVRNFSQSSFYVYNASVGMGLKDVSWLAIGY